VLALFGGFLGSAIALWAKDLFWAWIVGGTFDSTNAVLDLRVFAFTIALSLVIGIVFGIAPALRLVTANFGTSSFMMKSLLVTQVGVAIVLVVAAGLFASTLINLNSIDTGFNRRDLLLLQVDAELANIPET